MTAGHSKKLMIDMSGPKEGDNNNDNDDEKRLSDHTAPPCYKKKRKNRTAGTVYTDQGKKRTLKSGSVAITGFPLGLEKPGKMGRHFPVREKSGNFEQTGKVRENHTKYWKIEIN